MTNPQLKTLGHVLGLNAQALAKLAKVTERSARRWLDGTHKAPPGVMAQLTDILDRAATARDAALEIIQEAEADEIALTRHEAAENVRDSDPRLTAQEVLVVHHTALALIMAEDSRVIIVHKKNLS